MEVDGIDRKEPSLKSTGITSLPTIIAISTIPESLSLDEISFTLKTFLPSSHQLHLLFPLTLIQNG